MAIFSNSELKKIKTMSNPVFGGDEPQRLLTEVELTNRSLTESEKKRKLEEGSQYELDYGYKAENVTERSNVLAPFNSTITNEDFQKYFCHDLAIEDAKIIKFSDKVREANRQYEFNYNDEVDNGIMISINNGDKDGKDESKEKAEDRKSPQLTETSDEYNLLKPLSTEERSFVEDAKSSSAIDKNARKLQQRELQKVSLAAAGEDNAESESIVIIEAQPVINFNGIKQIGYMHSPTSELKPIPLINDKKSARVAKVT